MEELQLNQVISIRGRTAPIVATAIHDGHFVRRELIGFSGLTAEERLREEDPFTAKLIEHFPAMITGLRSRFEFDLNRAPDKAIYIHPEDAWGLNVWKTPPSEQLLLESKAMYEMAFNEMRPFFQACIDEYGSVVVFDCHSYNHKRDGAEGQPADQQGNPDVNLGTKNMNKAIWQPVVDALIKEFSNYQLDDKPLDVRENIKFKGGYFSEWLYREFGDKVCAVAIEFKKIFMNEWTGELHEQHHTSLSEMLLGAYPLVEQLREEINAKL